MVACHMCHMLAPRAKVTCGWYRSVMCQASELRYKTGRTYGITYLHWPSTMCCCYIVNTLSSLVGVKPTELVNVLPRAVATTYNLVLVYGTWCRYIALVPRVNSTSLVTIDTSVLKVPRALVTMPEVHYTLVPLYCNLVPRPHWDVGRHH